MKKPLSYFFILAINIVPVFGVLFYDWQPFQAFWVFWLETLIMAVFNMVRIVFSQNQLEGNGGLPRQYNIGKGFKYFMIRLFIFFFYSIFIIGFIGFVANTHGNKKELLATLLFQNRVFNLSLLISIFSQGYYLVFYFFRNRVYLTANPEQYAALFDGRQLVIHVAVVVGAVGSIYLNKNTSFGSYANTFIISLLCICKCIVELFNYNPAPAVENQ